MEVVLGSVLDQLDPKLLAVCVAVITIVGILALVKKAVKLGLIVLAISVASSTVIPIAKDFQEKYKFDLDNGVATIAVEGKEYKLDKEIVKEIKMINMGLKGYDTEIIFVDGNINVTIPAFMLSKIKGFTDKNKINLTIFD